MPKTRGTKRKIKKGKKRADGRKLLAQELLERKNELENVRMELVTQVSSAMTKYWQDANKIEDLEKITEQRAQDALQSRLYLAREVTQCEGDINTINGQAKQALRDIKDLEKTNATEKNRIEDHYAKLKNELLSNKEKLISQIQYSNLFKIMHRDIMLNCLKTEKTCHQIDVNCRSSIKNFENHSIIQISQLKLAAKQQLSTFLNTASECFEKMIGQRTQQVIRENLTLSRQADVEFKDWMDRKRRLDRSDIEERSQDISFESKHLGRHIPKLERILAILKDARDAEFKKSVTINPQESMNKDDQIAHLQMEIEKVKCSYKQFEERQQIFQDNFDMLRDLLLDIAVYVKTLKTKGCKYELADYEKIATKIIECIADYNKGTCNEILEKRLRLPVS